MHVPALVRAELYCHDADSACRKSRNDAYGVMQHSPPETRPQYALQSPFVSSHPVHYRYCAPALLSQAAACQRVQASCRNARTHESRANEQYYDTRHPARAELPAAYSAQSPSRNASVFRGMAVSDTFLLDCFSGTLYIPLPHRIRNTLCGLHCRTLHTRVTNNSALDHYLLPAKPPCNP